MPIDFYLSAGSPPCRSIQMVATAVGVELNEIAVNTQAKEHLTPEFLKVLNLITNNIVLHDHYQKLQKVTLEVHSLNFLPSHGDSKTDNLSSPIPDEPPAHDSHH